MRISSLYRHGLVLVCAALLLLAGVAPVQSSMVGTEQLVQQQTLQAERQRLLGLLARDDVRQQLSALGVDAELAALRTERLGSEELQVLNTQLDELPAGAGAGTVIGIVVLFTLVFIVTDSIGATDIFPFINPVR